MAPALPCRNAQGRYVVRMSEWQRAHARVLAPRLREVEAARRQGMASMILWVLEDNEQARRFYARQGFVPDGARKMEDHVPDAELAVIRMCRSL